jgi:anti-anti-sigma factor
MPAPDEPFHCGLDADGDMARITPVGELDLATVDEVEKRFREAREQGFARIVMDLRGLSFMDSSGLRLILSHQAESGKNGFRFMVIPGSRNIQRVFEISGVLEHVPFVSGPDGRG